MGTNGKESYFRKLFWTALLKCMLHLCSRCSPIQNYYCSETLLSWTICTSNPSNRKTFLTKLWNFSAKLYNFISKSCIMLAARRWFKTQERSKMKMKRKKIWRKITLTEDTEHFSWVLFSTFPRYASLFNFNTYYILMGKNMTLQRVVNNNLEGSFDGTENQKLIF